jgi:hypothetical protein
MHHGYPLEQFQSARSRQPQIRQQNILGRQFQQFQCFFGGAHILHPHSRFRRNAAADLSDIFVIVHDHQIQRRVRL